MDISNALFIWNAEIVWEQTGEKASGIYGAEHGNHGIGTDGALRVCQKAPWVFRCFLTGWQHHAGVIP